MTTTHIIWSNELLSPFTRLRIEDELGTGGYLTIVEEIAESTRDNDQEAEERATIDMDRTDCEALLEVLLRRLRPGCVVVPAGAGEGA